MKRRINYMVVVCLCLIFSSILMTSMKSDASTVRKTLTFGSSDYITLDSNGEVIYSFTVSKPGRVKFDVTAYNDSIYWSLYDSDGDGLNVSNALKYNSTLGFGNNSFYIDLKGGAYYIKIYAYGNNKSFSMKTSYKEATVTETEPNNSFLGAVKLVSDKAAYGQLAIDDDVDIYTFSISKSADVRYKIKSYDLSQVYLTLYDSDGNKEYTKYIYKDNNLNDVLEYTISRSLSEGRYYLCVESVGAESTGSYGIVYSSKIALGSQNVSLSASMCEYNGLTRNPSVIVKDNYGMRLTSGVDYSVYVPAGRKNIGTYTYKIVFKGDYKGTVYKNFTILPARTRITAIANKPGGIKIRWNAKSSANCTGYIVYRSVNGGAYKQIGIIRTPSTTTYGDTGARVRNYRYSYKVIVYKKVGEKVYKAVASNGMAITRK